MRCFSLLILLPLVLVGAACNRDGPIDPEPIDQSRAIPVLGHGALTDRYTSEVWVHGNWAYTGTWGSRNGRQGNVLYVWNVAGNTPVLTDSVFVSDARTLGDLQVTDDGRLLIVATEQTEGARGSIVVYDLENPARPRQISRLSTENTAAGVHTAEVARVGGRLHAFLSVNPPAPRLVIVDLGDPAAPREVLVRPMGGPFIHDVFVRDGLLFTALWNGGMTIWDIGGGGRGGSVANPVQISNLVTVGGKVHNIWWFHDPTNQAKRYVFVGEEGPGFGAFGSSSSGDIHVVDISDINQPREVAFYTVNGAGTHNFSVDEASGILYAAYYNGGVRALDIRGDLSACTAAQRSPDGRCDLGRMGREVGVGLQGQGPVFIWGVHWTGGPHLYASDMLNGLWKLNVSALRREGLRFNN
jgi:hypothetical protein